jgi:hypothetical protein
MSLPNEDTPYEITVLPEFAATLELYHWIILLFLGLGIAILLIIITKGNALWRRGSSSSYDSLRDDLTKLLTLQTITREYVHAASTKIRNLFAVQYTSDFLSLTAEELIQKSKLSPHTFDQSLISGVLLPLKNIESARYEKELNKPLVIDNIKKIVEFLNEASKKN